MTASEIPTLTVSVSVFLQELEQRLEADEEKYACCVCFEPFANASLKCCHKLCPDCYEQLDTCPQCGVQANEKPKTIIWHCSFGFTRPFEDEEGQFVIKL